MMKETPKYYLVDVTGKVKESAFTLPGILDKLQKYQMVERLFNPLGGFTYLVTEVNSNETQ